jgi:hypothetical protein
MSIAKSSLLGENFSGAVKNFGALGRWRQAPIFEGALRGVDGLVDVLGARCREHADQFARIRGVAILDGFAAARGNPFSVDVILKDFWRYCGGHAKSSRFECNLKWLRRLDDDPALTTHGQDRFLLPICLRLLAVCYPFEKLLLRHKIAPIEPHSISYSKLSTPHRSFPKKYVHIATVLQDSCYNLAQLLDEVSRSGSSSARGKYGESTACSRQSSLSHD